MTQSKHNLPLIEPTINDEAKQQIESLYRRLLQNNDNTTAPASYSRRVRQLATCAVAVMSGALYWLSANGAEKRYGKIAESWLPFCAFTINTLFNEEVYLRLFVPEEEPFLENTASLTKQEKKRFNIITSMILGLCTDAPVTYISLPNSNLQLTNATEYRARYLLALTSGAVNLPVYALSAYTLIQWMNENDILSRSIDRLRTCFKNSIHSQQPKDDRLKKQQWISELTHFQRYYNQLSKEERKALLENFKAVNDIENKQNSNSVQCLHKQLISKSRSYVRQAHLSEKAQRAARYFNYFAIATSVIQLLSYAVQAFNSGELIEKDTGIDMHHLPGASISCITLLVSLGFVIMLLGELQSILESVVYKEPAIQQQISPRLFTYTYAILGSMALFSATGSDVAGYNSFTQVFSPTCNNHSPTIANTSSNPSCPGVKASAQTWALLSNAGAAIYNFMMLTFLINRGIEAVIERKGVDAEKEQLRFSKNLSKLIYVARNCRPDIPAIIEEGDVQAGYDTLNPCNTESKQPTKMTR